MDLATLIGMGFGIVVVVGAILAGGSFSTFVNVPGLLVVIGGTIAATLIKFSLADCIYAIKLGAKMAFVDESADPNELVRHIKEMAKTARKDGLLALEEEEFTNHFLKKGVDLCVNGQSPEMCQKILSTDMDNSIARMALGSRIFSGIGDAAPAFGMIGTLVGLVQMLANMSDPSAIGPAMAVALLTTLYGAVIANLFALPISDKLKIREEYDRKTKNLIIEGVLGIAQGENPHVLDEILTTYLHEATGEAAAEPSAA